MKSTQRKTCDKEEIDLIRTTVCTRTFLPCSTISATMPSSFPMRAENTASVSTEWIIRSMFRYTMRVSVWPRRICPTYSTDSIRATSQEDLTRQVSVWVCISPRPLWMPTSRTSGSRACSRNTANLYLLSKREKRRKNNAKNRESLVLISCFFLLIYWHTDLIVIQ